MFNLNLLRNAKKLGFIVIEFPVIHKKRKEGKSFMSLARIFEMTLNLLKYSIKKR